MTWSVVPCPVGLAQTEGAGKIGKSGERRREEGYVHAEAMVIAKGILVQELLAQEIAFCRSFPFS